MKTKQASAEVANPILQLRALLVIEITSAMMEATIMNEHLALRGLPMALVGSVCTALEEVR